MRNSSRRPFTPDGIDARIRTQKAAELAGQTWSDDVTFTLAKGEIGRPPAARQRLRHDHLDEPQRFFPSAGPEHLDQGGLLWIGNGYRDSSARAGLAE